MIRLLSRTFAVSAILSGVALTACSGHPTHVSFGEPAAVASFVEVSQSLGLTVPQGAVAVEPNCLFNAKKITARFPKVVPPRVSKDIARQCDPEHSSGGAGAVDVNGDGLDDLVFTRTNGSPLLFMNHSTPGHPAFTNESTSSGFAALTEPTNGVGAVDVDNDGDQDIFLSVFAAPHMYLLINDGHGHFADDAVARGIGMVDGMPHAGTSISFGDIDNDGWIDVHTNEWQSNEVFQYGVPSHSRLFRNLGASGKPGVFQDITDFAGVGIESRIDNVYSFASTLNDFDGDGFDDLAIAADFNTSRLFWNNGDGTFTEDTIGAGVADEENGMGLAVGFLHRSTRPALMVTSIMATSACEDESQLQRTGNRLYVYNKNRSFDNVTDRAGVRDGGWGWGAAFFDSRNSGSLDIVSAVGMNIDWDALRDCYKKGPVRYWTNDGDDMFSENAAAAGLVAGRPSKAVVISDLDRDGRLDVVMTRDEATPRVFMNHTKKVGHFVDVLVSGTISNADARGAIVSVKQNPNDSARLAFVGGSSRFLSSDSRVVHVGLGRASSKISELSVYFPASKKTVTLHNVTVDTLVKVQESQ